MEISFPCHQVQDRNLEVSEEDLASIQDAMVKMFMLHIEYGNYDLVYPSAYEKAVIEICKKYNVNYRLKEDRLAFFTALLGVKDELLG